VRRELNAPQDNRQRDDLGISEEANDAIFRGMTNGLITSTSILSNGPAMEASQRMLGFFPQCSIGVHLNLSEFEPFCEDSVRGLASVLDENGHFDGNVIREVRIDVPMIRAIFRGMVLANRQSGAVRYRNLALGFASSCSHNPATAPGVRGGQASILHPEGKNQQERV